MNEFNDNRIQHILGGRLMPAAGVFILDSLEPIVMWLIVMFWVILTDLLFGVRKSWLMGVEVRMSRAFRATMGKMVTYFSFVVMAVFVGNAAGNAAIAKWAIMGVIAIEFFSIVSNILRPKGYDISPIKLLEKLFKKYADTDLDGVITKTDEKPKDN